MSEQNYTTSIIVDQTPKEVFEAVTNVRGWWSQNIEGETTKQDDQFTYEVKGIHLSKQKLVEVIPDKKVVWLVTEGNMSFVKDKSEWVGTKVTFDISKEGEKTKLVFTHNGLLPSFECYNICSTTWAKYVEDSLFKLITTGKGTPNLEIKNNH